MTQGGSNICAHVNLRLQTRCSSTKNASLMSAHKIEKRGTGREMQRSRKFMLREILFCSVLSIGVTGLATTTMASPGKGNHYGWGNGHDHGHRRGGTKTAPAPLIGLGIPAAGGALFAAFLARRRRRKDQSGR
jgi:hypothetical protein